VSDNRYESLVERLTAVAAELDELAFDRLRAQLRDLEGDDAAAAKTEEKRLQQARRAIAKAITALGGHES
jgi:hypothetical protein